ncbi:hypothetical protein J6590_037875 [Homalodisca vitripennis]|nr:hypothetical protein J6590_037875 [Homalodisca vitripennis]
MRYTVQLLIGLDFEQLLVSHIRLDPRWDRFSGSDQVKSLHLSCVKLLSQFTKSTSTPVKCCVDAFSVDSGVVYCYKDLTRLRQIRWKKLPAQ